MTTTSTTVTTPEDANARLQAIRDAATTTETATTQPQIAAQFTSIGEEQALITFFVDSNQKTSIVAHDSEGKALHEFPILVANLIESCLPNPAAWKSVSGINSELASRIYYMLNTEVCFPLNHEPTSVSFPSSPCWLNVARKHEGLFVFKPTNG